MTVFENRREAGRQLAAALRDHPALQGADPLVVLAIPRGGLPVGAEVAAELRAAFDVAVVRKLRSPHNQELAFGSVGADGHVDVDDEAVAELGLTDEQVRAEIADREDAVRRRVDLFRGVAPAVDLEGATVVVVDDGIATGGSARQACQLARRGEAATVVLAVPVAPRGSPTSSPASPTRSWSCRRRRSSWPSTRRTASSARSTTRTPSRRWRVRADRGRRRVRAAAHAAPAARRGRGRPAGGRRGRRGGAARRRPRGLPDRGRRRRRRPLPPRPVHPGRRRLEGRRGELQRCRRDGRASPRGAGRPVPARVGARGRRRRALRGHGGGLRALGTCAWSAATRSRPTSSPCR